MDQISKDILGSVNILFGTTDNLTMQMISDDLNNLYPDYDVYHCIAELCKGKYLRAHTDHATFWLIQPTHNGLHYREHISLRFKQDVLLPIITSVITTVITTALLRLLWPTL